TPREQSIIFHRIRATNHPSLSAANHKKMQRYYKYLLRRLNELGQRYPLDETIEPQLNVIIKALYDLTQSMPDFAALTCRNYVVQLRDSCFPDPALPAAVLQDNVSAW